MALAATYQEPFTMYPNRYIDYHKPKLTNTQRDICDLVIRHTYGWHRTSAHISNSMFTEHSGKSERAIITAKKQLIAMGLLVLISNGGGSHTSEYKLDLYYDTPAPDISSTDKSDIAIQDDDIIDAAPDSIKYSGDNTNNNDVMDDSTIESDSTTDDVAISDFVPIAAHDVPIDDHDDIPTGAHYIPSPPDDIPPSHDVYPAPHYIPSQPTPELTSAPPNNDLDNNIYINKIHTEADKVDNTPHTMSTSGAAIVCHEFNKLFPEAAGNSDYPFFGWIAKEYGVDKCMEKLQLLSEYRRGRPIANPQGLFRMSLVNDYQPSARVVAKLKADRVARRAMEESSRRAEEWSNMVADFDYDGAAEALQKLIDSLG